MNDKDRELLQQILASGGAAAQKGFEALVRWCFVDALANVICYSLVVGLGLYLLSRLLKWQPEKGGYDDMIPPRGMRIIGLLIVCGILAICTGSWLPGNLRELIAPQGEAVAYVLGHHL